MVGAERTATMASGSLRLYSTYYQTYEQLYEKQPYVRTCVDFLARNIAQLGLHVFRHKGETDRVRLRETGWRSRCSNRCLPNTR